MARAKLWNSGDPVKKIHKARTRRPQGTVVAEPVFISEPLMAYHLNRDLAKDQEIILTIKTTLQLEKNVHQAELMRSPTPDVFGRKAARPYVLGIVASFPLAFDHFNWNLAEARWAFSSMEPYGIDAKGTKMALATASSVQIVHIDTGETITCRNPWLNQGHTVEFSPNGTRLLVASSGFDAVFEFDTANGETVWDWFAWDHGFEGSKLGHYVVRSPIRYRELMEMGHDVLLVDDPGKYKFGLATRQKPAHLNSACYDSEDTILITLFHQGGGYVVDRNTGQARQVISGLLVPHKLSKQQSEGYFVSDTRRGKLILLDKTCRPIREIMLAGMPGVARAPELSEFLQNTTELRKDLFACIDIHRSCLWLIDLKRRLYRGINFPKEWSVHDIVPLAAENERRIGGLIGKQFGKVVAFQGRLKTIHHFSIDGSAIEGTAVNSI